MVLISRLISWHKKSILRPGASFSAISFSRAAICAFALIISSFIVYFMSNTAVSCITRWVSGSCSIRSQNFFFSIAEKSSSILAACRSISVIELERTVSIFRISAKSALPSSIRHILNFLNNSSRRGPRAFCHSSSSKSLSICNTPSCRKIRSSVIWFSMPSARAISAIEV